MKHFIRILFLTLILNFLTSCDLSKSGFIDLSLPEKQERVFTAEQLNYKIVNEEVLLKSCVGCHSEKGGNKGKVNLENYKNVFSERINIRKEVIEGTMPPRKRTDLKLSETQLNILIEWIDRGAPEFVDSPAIPEPLPPEEPPAEPPPVTPPSVDEPPQVEPNPPGVEQPIYFSEVFEKVIKTNCLKCHSADGDNDVILETYADVVENKFDVAYDIEQNFMPPKPPKGIPLTPEQKKLILDWIKQGALEKAP